MSKIEMSIIIIRFSVLDMNMIKMGSCFFLLHLNHKIKFLSEADDATDFI